MPGPVALTWSLSERTAWGITAVELASGLPELGWAPLLLGPPPRQEWLAPSTRLRLDALIAASLPVRETIIRTPGARMDLGIPVMHALSNGFFRAPGFESLFGAPDIGIIAFEDTELDADALARAGQYPLIIVHSSYNRALLAERGLPVRAALQGVDLATYRPLPRQGRFAGRFVVFSGGKLEYRKGQDLVLEGFRLFQRRCPNALLVTAWHSPWAAQLAPSMAQSPLVRVPPLPGRDGTLDMAGWARVHGVPARAFLDLGFLDREAIPQVLAECDVGLFPNRCEGGTNMVAMEAMACGLPCVLSANTGHLDLIRDDNCLALCRQTPCLEVPSGRRGWSDSDPEEIADALERLHADREAAARIGANAVAFIRERHTWGRFVRMVAAVLDGDPDPDPTILAGSHFRATGG